MIDRDQLTEARRRLRIDLLVHAGFTPAEVEALDDVARLLLDFPTDEMVEAHDAELRRLIPGVRGLIYRRASELMLEAVRQTMIGDTE